MKKEIFYPKKGTPQYKFLLAPKAEREKTLKCWKKLNNWVIKPLYRVGLLPLLGVGALFLLLYTQGWKTGKRRITPVEYHKKNDGLIIFASRGEKTHWLKNIKAKPEEVYVRIGFKKFKVKPQIIIDITERKRLLEWYIKKYPKAAKMLMGWDPKEDKIEEKDLTFIAENIVPVLLYKERKKKAGDIKEMKKG